MTDEDTTSTDEMPALARAIGIRVGAEQLVLRPEMLGVSHAAALRHQSHGAWRYPTLIDAVNEGVGPEEVAGLLFLARRQARQGATYDSVVAEIDAVTEGGGTVGLVYDAESSTAAAARAATIVIDFTWDPEDGSPEA